MLLTRFLSAVRDAAMTKNHHRSSPFQSAGPSRLLAAFGALVDVSPHRISSRRAGTAGEALRSDMKRVGKDFGGAIEKVGRSVNDARHGKKA
jgi:hypothetical protein